ncbi:hypothetical protein GVN18_37525 [Pseudomonas sp. ODNR1LW]|nr:hypothetical protein [Pseudomonas sp. ODNR1LW]
MPIWSPKTATGPTEVVHPYASLAYAHALSHAGRPVAVPEWGVPVLARSLPRDLNPDPGHVEDAMGLYPLTPFTTTADLSGGLERLRSLGLVSVVLVPDPLAAPSGGRLSEAFDFARPFKIHLTIDPARGRYSPSRHHAERIRRGHRRCQIDVGSLPLWLEDWKRLYRGLVTRRSVSGAAAFPDPSFEVMGKDPALVAFAASIGDRIVGMTLWFAWDGVIYNHLTAVDADGYANGASFALYDAAIQHFEGQGVVNLGGGAGIGSGEGGLFAFKSGFANGEVMTLLCGAVLDPARYAALGAGVETEFFPAYRA